MRHLVTPAGKPLIYSADDVLWLSRAVEAEGEPRELVAQTLVNRWAWLTDVQPGAYPALQDLVRAYAQPVNPRWYPEGDLLLKQYKAATAAEQPVLLAKAARRKGELSTRITFSAPTDKAVLQALTGPITLPAGTLHYAAAFVTRPDLPLLKQGTPGKTNSFWGESRGRGVGALYAFDEQGPTVALASVLDERPHAVLAFAFLATGLVLSMRGLRKRR